MGVEKSHGSEEDGVRVKNFHSLEKNMLYLWLMEGERRRVKRK